MRCESARCGAGPGALCGAGRSRQQKGQQPEVVQRHRPGGFRGGPQGDGGLRQGLLGAGEVDGGGHGQDVAVFALGCPGPIERGGGALSQLHAGLGVDGQHITGTERGEGSGKARTGGLRPGNSPILKDPFAPGRLKGL